MEGIEPKRPAADNATAENLKHLARLLDRGVPMSLKINGRRVKLPTDAGFAIDLERDPRSGCVKVDIRWSLPADEKSFPTLEAGVASDAKVAGDDAVVNGRRASEQHGKRDSAGSSAGRSSHIRLKALITAPTI